MKSDADAEVALIEVEHKGEKVSVTLKEAFAIQKVKRMTEQLKSFEAQPRLFFMMNYLDVIDQYLPNTKKIIIDSRKAKFNFQFDLKPQLLPDVGDLENTLNREN